jgi:hypothetical protein
MFHRSVFVTDANRCLALELLHFLTSEMKELVKKCCKYSAYHSLSQTGATETCFSEIITDCYRKSKYIQCPLCVNDLWGEIFK